MTSMTYTENNVHFNVQNKFYGLDHLRALAITLVFLFHYKILIVEHPVWMSDLVQFGWTGVDLFFVLSGFLIASQLFAEIKKGKKISIRIFFLKRFFRIIPAFWLIVGIYFCFPSFREKEALPPMWKFLTFTQNFGLNLSNQGTFSHAWSLCVEEHFYSLNSHFIAVYKVFQEIILANRSLIFAWFCTKNV
jgi:peptidoglycan/LPS O-acetylase OafA/YrhL